MKIESWVAEMRLAQGLPRKIVDRKTLDEINRIILDLPPKDESAEKQRAS